MESGKWRKDFMVTKSVVVGVPQAYAQENYMWSVLSSALRKLCRLTFCHLQ